MSPPFILPAAHLVAALVFWCAAAVGLITVAPALTDGLFPLPTVAGTTHLFTLGWITTSILGALYQFLPVALGVPIRSERAAQVSFGLYIPGLALFLAGFLNGVRPALLTGAVLMAAGLALFLVNLGRTLAAAPKRDVTWWCLTAAGGFLGVTLILGAALAANLGDGFLGESRFLALGVHIHVALVGWVLLVMIGVGRHLLPMFLLSHGRPEAPVRTAAGLVAAGVGLLVVAHHGGALLARLLPALLAGSGAALFLVHAMGWFRHRRKPRLDAGMRLAAAGLLLLALALTLAPGALLRGLADPRLATAYVAAMVLGISLFVAGHHYKILPFLVWHHRFGPRVGKERVPLVAELYDHRLAHLVAGLLAVGVAGMVLAILTGSAPAASAAAFLYAAGALLQTAQLLHVLSRRPA